MLILLLVLAGFAALFQNGMLLLPSTEPATLEDYQTISYGKDDTTSSSSKPNNALRGSDKDNIKVVESNTEEEEEEEEEEEKTRRRCWQYSSTEPSLCTKTLWYNEVLGGLCTFHARCAVAELVFFIQNEYEYYETGRHSLLDIVITDAQKYLTQDTSSVVTSRKIYVQLLHELRFDFLRMENRKHRE